MDAVRLRLALRRGLKVLHTLASAGFLGGLAAVIATALLLADATAAPSYAPMTVALARVAAWVVAPSMVAAVVTGLLSMAANPAFYDAGWVWTKAGTGVLVLEGGLHIVGPLQEEARRTAGVLTAAVDPTAAGRLMASEVNTAWALLVVAAANVILAVWRPRFWKD